MPAEYSLGETVRSMLDQQRGVLPVVSAAGSGGVLVACVGAAEVHALATVMDEALFDEFLGTNILDWVESCRCVVLCEYNVICVHVCGCACACACAPAVRLL